ncbi:MAG: hypothetical protein HDS35_04575 [Bacteroides sp.]|nr:hypothetical protein [Bacteroides sp.]
MVPYNNSHPPTAMMADAMATACIAAGSEVLKERVNKAGDEAILILVDSTVWTTSHLGKLLLDK